MRAIEFLTESRTRMYQYIKSIVPTWPDYIVKDWLYQGFGRYNDENPKRKLLTMINREGLNRNTQWQFVPNMKFTMDNMWTSHTLRKLQGRAGGLSDMGMDVPRDAERHATQAQLAQKQGGIRSEPVILIKRPDGYELLEGWHRTIQHFHKFPDGYTGPAYVAVAQSKQGVAEGKVINTYLWHGSRQKIPMLEPRQSVDTGGAAGSNQNAIYATSDPKVAIVMGLTTDGSDTGMFPNDPQMVLFSGKIRKGEYVYLHKLPFNGPDGKPQFVQGGNSREFHSIPGVEGIKPIEIKEIPVNKYLNLIRKATPADLKLRKRYMKKQGISEGLNESLLSLVAQDQSERNEYKNFVKSQAGGDWSKGAKMYAQLKKRPSNDIFGDATRLNQFMKMKFDFDKFTDEDWDNYWLLAQHCDDNRDFQKNALSIIKKYQGTDHSHYKYLYDRISMGLTGKQKYGTQNIKKQGVAEGKVVPLGKKHRGDLDSINSCSKCGGKLEGGTYMGQRIKVCLACKQVYLPPNSGIDQQGNKIKEQGVAEGLNELTNTSLKVKQPKDFVNTNDRKQVTWKVMKFKSGKDTYLINFTMQHPPAFGKKSKSNWNAVNVAFGVKEPQDEYSFGDEINTDLTARNKNQFLIYSTVINAIRKFITEYNTEIDEIVMQGAGERQEAMYQRFFQSASKYFPGWHYNGKHSLVRDVPRQTGKKVREQGMAEGTEHFDGIEISMEKGDDEITVTALLAGGRELGHVLFFVQDGVYLMPQDLKVDERYQGMGIAATMYNYVKSLGYIIVRSWDQTDAGAGFWDKHKPGKNVWEQGMAEGIDDPANLSRLQSVQSGRTALGLVNLPVVPSNDNPNTTAKVVNTGSRIVAVYKVRGVNIPFYISTGGGGKASVPTGKWYPVFGIHSSGWLNKGTEESINKFYGSKELARGAEILNKYLGDLRSVEDKIPLMKPDGYSIINKNLKPMSWHEVDSNVTEFKKRINSVLVQIGDAPHYPEVEYSKNDKKSQIVHLQNLAKFYPNITMKDFVNQGKEKIINDAMLEVNQLKNYYGQHKQADFVQLLSNLENDIDSFKRGSLANTNNQNSVPTLGLLLKGTLGKINFATP